MNRSGLVVDVVIPCLDEERSVGEAVRRLPRPLVRRVIVVDNASRDRSAEVARAAGAEVVFEARRGYGSACAAGVAALGADPADAPDMVVFMDADLSDDPTELPILVRPIADGVADLVIGSRTRGQSEKGALLPQARVGNAVACTLLYWLYGVRATDLGPFRAIRWDVLTALGLRDRGYGWTVEMQARAARAGYRTAEVSVRYRRRVGRSKITGTVRGTLGASIKILYTLLRHAPRRRPSAPGGPLPQL